MSVHRLGRPSWGRIGMRDVFPYIWEPSRPRTPGPPPIPRCLVDDKFIGVPGSLVVNRSPDTRFHCGDRWHQEMWNTFQIVPSGVGAYTNGYNNWAANTIDAGFLRAKVSADITVHAQQGSGGVCLGGYDNTNTFDFWALVWAGGSLWLYTCHNGVPIGAAVCPLAHGSTHNLRLEFDGANLSGFVDDILTLGPIPDTTYYGTYHGIVQHTAVIPWEWDNFCIEHNETVPPTIYVADDFNDVNQTDLNAHVPIFDVVGGGWQDHDPSYYGVWRTFNTAGFCGNPPGGARVVTTPATPPWDYIGKVIDAGVSDCQVEGTYWDWQDVNPQWEGMILRYQDPTHYWFTVEYGDGRDQVVLAKRVGGVTTIVDTKALHWRHGERLFHRAVLDGNSISVFIENITVKAHTTLVSVGDDTYATCTKHGLHSWPWNGYTPIIWEDFRIRSLET